MTLQHRVRFYQQLAVLARAGVPLRASLLRLQDRISGREMAVLTQKVNAGETLENAFTYAGFLPFECHLIAAGEKSARLETVFEHLSGFWARQREMRQDLLSQLYYPATMLHVALVMAAFSELVVGSWADVQIRLVEYFVGLYGMGFLLFWLIRFSGRNETAQRWWLRVPLIGSTLSSAFAYRWISALRIEFEAGIPLPDAVADAWRASGFVGGERFAREGTANLRDGMELSKLVQGWRRLPRDWVDFIETGEISGRLGTALENLAAEAARSYAVAQQRMTQWMPKIASVTILLIVGALVIHIVYNAYVLPIVKLEKDY